MHLDVVPAFLDYPFSHGLRYAGVTIGGVAAWKDRGFGDAAARTQAQVYRTFLQRSTQFSRAVTKINGKGELGKAMATQLGAPLRGFHPIKGGNVAFGSEGYRLKKISVLIFVLRMLECCCSMAESVIFHHRPTTDELMEFRVDGFMRVSVASRPREVQFALIITLPPY